uniref:GG10224 n=1 Tax=Drosophila erecta TaxID=7220 RepID=B3P2Q3_DROER
MKPRGASFLTALLSLHYEDNCGRRATKSRDNSLGFTFSAATGGSFNRCYKLDNNRLGSPIIISRLPGETPALVAQEPWSCLSCKTQRQIMAGFRSKQASRLPIANDRES